MRHKAFTNLTAYYNEIDPFAAAWLRELIKAGHIAAGEVDERSIEDVRPDDLRGYTQCHFFAGIGVWSHALRRAGWPDSRNVWTGSCPCQPFSTAGKRGGTADERHLWPAFFHLISQCTPANVFGEQVASKDGLAWFDLVQADLEGQNYAVGATDLCAAGFGAPHIRQRLYFCATNTDKQGLSPRFQAGQSGNASQEVASAWREFERVHATHTWWEWDAKSPIRVFADGATNRVGRLRGYGNALVAPVAQGFIEAFLETERERD